MPKELEGPYLPAVGPVATLSDEERRVLSSYGDFHLADQREVLVTQGNSQGRLFFVLSGLLHAVRRDGDREVLLGTIRSGEWVGEVDLFDPVTAMCSVIAIERVQYWRSAARISRSLSTAILKAACNSSSAWRRF
jgi:CRP-like cAMP-binding protein